MFLLVSKMIIKLSYLPGDICNICFFTELFFPDENHNIKDNHAVSYRLEKNKIMKTFKSFYERGEKLRHSLRKLHTDNEILSVTEAKELLQRI